ncbi:hypothetical protein BJ970_004984 [Saccharopolyspora phatthalungensis]|uniref:Uncharacterized protein n=1 Tax=Saccharopolyspora phatthalungensis TaxID=664693 RepID=A0A840QCE3_9PSEU|nr:hypothetical protein [Saccharopolyspora phatthalungensis]
MVFDFRYEPRGLAFRVEMFYARKMQARRTKVRVLA